jgi:transcriptional regulator with XRE-family HTH domain
MSTETASAGCEIGLRIKARLRTQHSTVRRLAAEIGMTEWALGRRVKGTVEFRTSELRDIAEVLGVPVEQLLREG